MSDLWPEIADLPDTEPMTFGELIGQATVPDERRPGWRSALPDPHAQRLESMVRERARRRTVEDALNRLREAVEAHGVAVPPKNARKADRQLWDVLEAIGGDDG